MTPKQKRAMNQLKASLIAINREIMADQNLINPATELLLRTTGTMLGTMSAALSLPVDELHASLARADRYMAKEAAEAYSRYLAFEKAGAKGGH